MFVLTRLLITAVVAIALPSFAAGDEANQTYQRYRNNPHANNYQHHRTQRPVWQPPVQAPSVQAGSFQRPYPYHLDYYKMRYGGSYEPYFGNLYGPPNVIVAPPYAAPNPYYGNQFGNQFNNQFGGPFGY